MILARSTNCLASAADPFEFGPIRVGQGKLPRSLSHAKLQNGLRGFASKWLLYR
jgi:hypothetical protein